MLTRGLFKNLTCYRHYHSSGSSHDLSQLYKNMKSQNLSVEDGYGEYIIHSTGPHTQIPEDLYNTAYAVTEKYRLNLGEVANRPHALRKELQIIDSNLDIAFIPRTLYELLYIRAAIQEETRDKAICPLQTIDSFKAFQDGSWAVSADKINRCWHLCRFNDKTPFDGQAKTLRTLSFRLNALAIETFRPEQHFTGTQIASFAEKEVSFLKNHCQMFSDIFRKEMKTFCGCSGAAINFGLPQGNGERVKCHPMGITDNQDAQIVYNAIALECDKSSQNSYVLYRGGDLFIPDDTTSICWGTSLFGGAFLDGTACVFHYVSAKKRKAYALVVPAKEATTAFHIPSWHPIRHLFSQGEFHHARSLLANHTSREESIKGICGLNDSPIPSYMYSALDRNKLTDQLAQYHNAAIRINESPF